MLDYSNLKNIAKIEGNYIFLKNGYSMHCHELNIQNQEELELKDLEVGRFINLIDNKK